MGHQFRSGERNRSFSGVNASLKDGGGNDDGGSGDTSNQQLPYETLFDVCEEVVNLSSVMEKLNLGPFGFWGA